MSSNVAMLRPLDIPSHPQSRLCAPDGRDSSTLPVCTICVQRRTDWTAVVLRGELDLGSAADVRACVEAESDLGRPVLVELAGLDFTDLTGIRALAELVREGESRDPPARIEVHGARGQAADLIELIGLEELQAPQSISQLTPSAG